MNKKDLINDFSNMTGKKKSWSKKFIEDTFEEISNILTKQGSITITGFGNFSVYEKEKRKGFNPAIEKFMLLPPKVYPKFKASDILKEKVNFKK